MADQDVTALDRTEEKGLLFDVMFRNKRDAWAEMYDDDNRYRVAEHVTMVRRDRSDYFGNFDDEWLNSRHPLQMTWKPAMSKGMVTYPVIRRSINAKIATEMATEIKLMCEPVRKDPIGESVSAMCDKIIAYCRRTNWDSNFDYAQSKMRQVGRLAYTYTSSDKVGGGVDLRFPVTTDKPVAYGDFSMNCETCGAQVTPEEIGIPHPIEATQQRLDDAYGQVQAAKVGAQAMGDKMPAPDETPYYDEAMEQPDLEGEHFCPMCAEKGAQSMLSPEATNLEYRLEPFHDGTFERRNSGSIKTQLINPLNTRIDEFGALGFKIDNAHYFCYRFLMPTYQLEQMCGDDTAKRDKIKGRNVDHWSDSVRWAYEMMKKYGNVGPSVSDRAASRLTEVEIWWVQPVACDGWTSPGDYVCGDWSIKRDETIADSFTKRKKGGKFEGLAVMMAGEEIIRVFSEDFRKKWTGFAWTVDPFAFFPQGEERLLHLQDAATRIFTLIYSFSQRASAPRTVANGLYFKKDDLKANVVGGHIMTKTGVKQPDRLNLQQHIFTLEVGELPQMMGEFVQMFISIVKEETGIYDEVTGAGSPQNRTASGRNVALNRSLGLQLPQVKSKGDGMINLAYQWLEHAQDMEDEFFLLFTDEGEEEWTALDIQNFRDTSMRREMNVSVVDGSDIPRTREDLEEAYLAALEIGMFDANSPVPIDVRSQMLKMRGIEYDVQDFDANSKVANYRYDRIKAALALVPEGDAVVMQPVIDPMTGMPTMQMGPDGKPGEPMLQPALNPKVVAELMQNPLTMPQEFADNHFIFIDFFKKKLFGVIAAKEMNVPLMLAITLYIQAHRGYIAAEMQRTMSLQGGPPQPAEPGDGEGGKPGEKPPGKPTDKPAPKPPGSTGIPK